jgi:glycosyltransferase involved in cell wall biosynthesis
VGSDLCIRDSPRAVRAELGLPGDAPLVGEVGRLCDVKGQRELIQALAHVPEARAVLVGADLEQGGAYQRQLEQTAEAVGVRDRVVFAGRRNDVGDVLAELDVFALPSWTEGLPLVVLEAMARRTPVVATKVGGTPEVVVDGETGLLVPPRDPEALAAALRRLLEDADLRRRLGDAGYARVRDRFSAEAMMRRVLELYDEVLA